MVRSASLFIAALLSCLVLHAGGNRCLSSGDFNVRIESQAQFDVLDETVDGALAAGKKRITIEFAPGTYFFRDAHLKLGGANPSASISIDGNGAVLCAAGSSKPAGADPERSYLHGDSFLPLNPWSRVFQLEKQVEIADKGRKLCRVPAVSGLKVAKGDWIQVSRWYTSSVHRITDVKNGYIYFEVPDLSYSLTRLSYNINMDYGYARRCPRYRILSSSALEGRDVFECRAINFMNVNDRELKSFRLSDIVFRGCAYTNWKGLIRFNGVKSDCIEVSDCRFEGCRSVVLNINNTEGFVCRGCVFEGNYDTCINSDNRCRGTKVQNCTFIGNGQSWSNVFDVAMAGEDFEVSGNSFSDFAYSAIALGVYWENRKTGICSGVVENNEIYYTPAFFASKDRHTLMDSGAIYLLTQNDDVKVRYNCIHDITGMADNRGIFCDDGAFGFSIRGNVIYNIANSYCIDSRKVSDVAAKTGRHNEDIVISENVLDGTLRFEGNGRKGNGCIKGRNYLLVSRDGTKSVGKSKLSGLDSREEDLELSWEGSKDGAILLGKASFKALKKNPSYKFVKKYFVQ